MLFLTQKTSEIVTNKPICETDGNGDKRWYLNGKLHRTDGPAIELANGNKYWYLNGEQVEMEDVLTDPKEQSGGE